MELTSYALALVQAAGQPVASHARPVAELAGDVAAELGLGEAACQEVQIAALLHDVGKAALMTEILDKPSGLSADEVELVKTHPARAQAMLESAGRHFAPIAAIVRSCHERWDGGGYPDRLAGEDIPLPARVIFCSNAFQAMTDDRPYSAAVSESAAIGELWAATGTQFDPRVVEALTRALSRRRMAGPDRAERDRTVRETGAVDELRRVASDAR
ncbi:MAG: HD-GYP domain-containing protein [Thermoleophilaceae bacterium]|nr:HD domain-containing protein [Thermoleophilaceae bacterium]